MKKRGRVSAGELSVLSPVVKIERPDAPYNLCDQEAEIWRAIVEDLPADWFPRHTHDLLGQYCRHAMNAERIAQLIHQVLYAKDQALDVNEYDQLLKIQEREGRAMSSIATRLRITPQATRLASSQKATQKGKRPWET